MYWNLNARKTLGFKTPEKWTFVLNKLKGEFQNSA